MTDPTTKAEPIADMRQVIFEGLCADLGFACPGSLEAERIWEAFQALEQREAVDARLAEANAKLEAAEQQRLEAAEGYRSLLKDYMDDKDRHRATEEKLKAAELELAHCREAAELLRREMASGKGYEWSGRKRAEWYYRDQQRQPVAANPSPPAPAEPEVTHEDWALRGSPQRPPHWRPKAEPEATAVGPCDCGMPSAHLKWCAWRRVDLSPAASHAPEALEAQDPMLRCPTFGELRSLLQTMVDSTHGNVLSGYELMLSELERIAKGGGKS